MYYGEYKHTCDEKGRIFIPAKFRVIAQGTSIDSFYITRGLEKCLFVYEESEWVKLTHKFKELPMTQAKSRAFTRLFFSGAYEATCDKQGRVNIPAHLLEYASLKKEAVVIGVSNRFEIWDEKAWKGFYDQSLASYEKIAEELVDLGI
ncbi:MAG: division/cell wall cluster transcriptional repressor MraZ [Candidatus Ancaeobacter aquaticus]|nr:division/cell wall cluster transcriptional repressor MraZ [Candidatus Ancaeobacter aquaticus]